MYSQFDDTFLPSRRWIPSAQPCRTQSAPIRLFGKLLNRHSNRFWLIYSFKVPDSRSTAHENDRSRTRPSLTPSQGENSPGFGLALFQVISNRDGASLPTRHAASIYLKNLAKKHWKTHFTEQEKATIRDNLVQAVITVEIQSIREMLGLIVRTVAEEEFPGAWPGFVTTIMQCMSSGEAQHVAGGLFLLDIFAKMTQFYRTAVQRGDENVSGAQVSLFFRCRCPLAHPLG